MFDSGSDGGSWAVTVEPALGVRWLSFATVLPVHVAFYRAGWLSLSNQGVKGFCCIGGAIMRLGSMVG